MRKQVQFDLDNDLGDMQPLPAYLISFLGDATDEWTNASIHLPPSAMSSLRSSSNGDSQHHAIPLGGAWPKTGTAVSSKPLAAGQARTRYSESPDLMASPID